MSVEIIVDRNGRDLLQLDGGERHLDPSLIFVRAVDGVAFIARDGFYSRLGPPGRADDVELIEHWLSERGVPEPVVKIGGGG